MGSETSTGDSGQCVPTNHVLIEVPAGGKESAKEVIDYRVGPACNYRFFRDWRNQQMLVLWGGSLSTDTLRRLGDACHELEQEHADMAIYDGASAADRMEGAFIFENRQERYLHTDNDQESDR